MVIGKGLHIYHVLLSLNLDTMVHLEICEDCFLLPRALVQLATFSPPPQTFHLDVPYLP